MLFSRAKSFFRRFFEEYRSYLILLSKQRSREGLYGFLREHYAQIPFGAEVLTVGAGGEINDLLMAYSTAKSFRVVSLDIDQNRDPDVVGDICATSLGPSRFDVVVLCEVIEHLKSPEQGLANIHQMLKPGGKLILSAPFVFPIHDQPHDYFRFTRFGLEMLLESFRDVVVTQRNTYFEAIDVLWMRLLLEKSPRALIAGYVFVPIIYFIKRPITMLLNRLIPVNGMTTGYIATAIKHRQYSRTQID